MSDDDEITDDWELCEDPGFGQGPIGCVVYDFEQEFHQSTTRMLNYQRTQQALAEAAIEGLTDLEPAEIAELSGRYAKSFKFGQDLTFMPASPYSEEGLIWLAEASKRHVKLA